MGRVQEGNGTQTTVAPSFEPPGMFSIGYGIGRAKTGPNDAKRVVWTLGELFLFFSVFFSY
jgi:hypothetical protein